MSATRKTDGELLRLDAATAGDLMGANPISLRVDANIKEALMLLTDKSIGAAPVIDDAGHPVGVLSRSDILVHERERPGKIGHDATYFYEQETRGGHKIPENFEIEDVDGTTVGDVMTPAVFSVNVTAPATKVISEMVGLHVHRLFVVDASGTLVGVVTTMDVLKKLRPA